MRLHLKAYLEYLKRAAVGIPAAPFSSFLWVGFGDAVVEVVQTLGVFALSLATIATYPVSVFVIGTIAFERDRRSEKRHAEWLREMSRGDCIDWTE